MGLNSTNDAWCARSDPAVSGVTDAQKIVDDILVSAEQLDKLWPSIRRVLTRCRALGITISNISDRR